MRKSALQTSEPSKTTGEKSTSLASSRSKDARARRSAVALRAALLALLEREPLERISIRDICAEAQVHYATFFRHYLSKEALLDAIAIQQIADLNRLTLKIGDGGDYHAGFAALCQFVDNQRGLWTTLLNGGAGAAMREEWMRQSRAVALREGPANSWLPMDLGVICASTLIAETLAWWLSPTGRDYDVQEVATILLKLLTTPIITKP